MVLETGVRRSSTKMAAAGIRNDNFFQLFNKDLATHFASTLAWVALFATVVFADSDGSSRGGDSLGVDQHVSHIGHC